MVTEKMVEKALKQRYEKNWNDISKLTRKMTGGKCCYPGCGKNATSTHHTNYYEKSKPLINRFPLCDFHHGFDHKGCKLPPEKMHPTSAHHPYNWNKGTRENLYRDAGNTKAYVETLKLGVMLITQDFQRSA